MKRWSVLVLIVSSLIGLTSCSSNKSKALFDGERIYPLSELEYLVDTTNLLTIEKIGDAVNSRQFNRSSNYQNSDFIPNVSYWVRFQLPLDSLSNATLRLLEFYDQTIDSLEVYRILKDGTRQLNRMGDHQPFSHRTFRHKNFEIVIQPKTDLGTYYFKVRSHSFADIRIAYRSIDRFVYYALNEYFLYGTFYGMILIIALYNFLAYLAIREIKNIYYIFYILSVALYAMSLDGTGFQYVWPEFPEWNDRSLGVALYLVIFWASVFTRRFLSTKVNAPHLDRLLYYCIVLRSLFFVVALFIYPRLFAYPNADILPLSLIFYTAIYVWRNGYRPARYFVIAYGLLFFGFFIKTLVYFDILPFTIVSHYSLHISFVLEMLFLTVALGDRIRILKDNRDRAHKRIIQQLEVNRQLQDKVTGELEQKVKERTVELDTKNVALEESNHKLIKQGTEINQINSLLDLDNWKLKNRIKEVLEEWLLEKAMDYAEFKTLYPDMLACYRFLEELKWKTSFKCHKCSNTKFFDGATKFARRCTRCGYNESITAFTVFHGIKFPIEKAFYIAYLSVVGKKESTLEATSKQLEVGLNTVWAFRSKVVQRIKELDESGKRPSASRWEDVILSISLPSSKIIKSEGLIRSVN